jgi:hypothetical protein
VATNPLFPLETHLSNAKLWPLFSSPPPPRSTSSCQPVSGCLRCHIASGELVPFLVRRRHSQIPPPKHPPRHEYGGAGCLHRHIGNADLSPRFDAAEDAFDGNFEDFPIHACGKIHSSRFRNPSPTAQGSKN